MKNSRFNCFVLVCFFFICLKANAILQENRDSLIVKAQELKDKREHKALITFTQKAIQNLALRSAKDSLTVSKLYYYQSKANYESSDNLASIKSCNLGILFAPNTEKGREYKGRIYADRAWPEGQLYQTKKAIKSLKNAIEILEKLKDKNPSVLDAIVNCYVLQSSQLAYLGNLEAAKRSLRFAESLYLDHKKALDGIKINASGNYHRYEIILLYRKIYLLYSLGKSQQDSLEIENTLLKLEKAHASKKFNTSERIYYTTSLNHIGDWFLSYKEDSLITKEDVRRGNYFIDKSIDFTQNKGYPGSYFSFKYNKCKALTKSNKLEKADQLIDHLLDTLPKKNGIRAFFLAQKGLILAKSNRKKESLAIFHQVIEHVHQGEEKLAKDYHNFKPSEVFNQSRLINRVAEKINLYFGDDLEVRKITGKLYHLALLQFKNSYGKAKFNTKENDLLRKILYGFLVAKKENNALKNISLAEVLSTSETIINRRAWQQFNQNRYTSSLSEIDSLTNRDLELRSNLVTVKKQDDLQKVDSIQNLITIHENYTQKQYPNLTLLSEQKFELTDLQQKLANNEMVLKYLFVEDKLAVFSITAKNIVWQLIPWKKEEKSIVTNISEEIIHRSFKAKTAEKLSRLILPEIPIEIQKIIINPDGELYTIPFEVLLYNSTFLLENFTLSYTSNLGFIHLDNLVENENKKAFIYAPNYGDEEEVLATRGSTATLVGARKESEMISKLFPSEIYLGKDVSKEVFLKTAPKASVLHLAMHAEIDTDESGLSRLIFGKENEEKQDLYLEELYALNLNADMAVLSACNTGLGKENAGRSMESFERAFTFSGVAATVASLWEVPDVATSQIMESFYQNLKQGNSKSEALIQAKLDYVKSNKGTKLDQPFYWAGFVLYGENKALVKTNNTIFILLLLFSLSILFVLFSLRIKRKKEV